MFSPTCAYSQCSKTAGYTLLEGLITLTIIAIFMVMALPDFSSLRSQRAAMLANNLVTAVQTARAQALYYHAALFICPSGDGVTCGTDWNLAHVLVTMPANAAGVARVLYDIPMPSMPGKLTWRGFGVSTYPQLNPSGDSFQHNGTWRYCSDDSENQSDNRTIVLSPTGKVTVTVGEACK